MWAECAVILDGSIYRLALFSHPQPREVWSRELLPDNFLDICCFHGSNKFLSTSQRGIYVALLQTYSTWVMGSIPLSVVPTLLSNAVFGFTTKLLEEWWDPLGVLKMNDPKGRLGTLFFPERVALLWSFILAAVEASELLLKQAMDQVLTSQAIEVIGEWSFTCSPEQSRPKGDVAPLRNSTRI